MGELDMLLWVWLIAGGVTLLSHVDRLPDDADFRTVLFVLVAWPWCISHYSSDTRRKERPEEHLAPVRVEVQPPTKHRKRRKR